jgi:hypothetical protein
MATKNWTHLFIDGRRVSFDRRDDSVTLYPDEDFRVSLSTRIGYAERTGSGWKVSAPDGATHYATSRKAAAEWLIEATAIGRADAEAERQRQEVKDDDAIKQATAILETLAPDLEIPRPFRISADASPFFVLSPEGMQEPLLALTDDSGPRRLPLAVALERVTEHYVVLFSLGADPYAEPHPFDWGFLASFAFEDVSADRPDLGAYAEFWFERDGGDESMIGIPGLGSTALVTKDAIVVEDEGGYLAVVIADEPSDTLDVPANNVWEWDRQAIVQLAQGPPPVEPDDEDSDSA